MKEIVGVRFKSVGKIYYFSPGDINAQVGDRAIVETVRGVECGEVVIANRQIEDDLVTSPLKPIIRLADENDMKIVEKNKQREKDAFKICEEKIAFRKLSMKLVDVECTFDNNKLLFYFTAENRVDFRELVKDLAAVFRTRIELRQIGVRDEAKILGGLGICGREFCCKAYMSVYGGNMFNKYVWDLYLQAGGQETVDFEKVKAAGCEFVYMRLGGYDNGEFYTDRYYKGNIAGAKAAGLKVGVYWHAEDGSPEEAAESAKYLMDVLGDETLDLPIAYDWEDFGNFEDYGMNLYDINKCYEAFANQVEIRGYDACLYSSKNFLENTWTNEKDRPVWLAHYVSSTKYSGKYFMWQHSSDGRIDGINGPVDLDVLYLD